MEKIKKLVLKREAVKRLRVRAGIRTGVDQVGDKSKTDIDSGGPYQPGTSHQGGGVQGTASLISPPSASA